MPSIDERLSRIERQLNIIERTVRDLARDKNLRNKVDEWMPEKEAATILNYRPRTLRLYVKAGKIPIPYQDRNGRSFQYQREYVLKFKNNPTYLK